MKQILISLLALFLPFLALAQPVDEIKKILATDGSENDLFGISVDISGDYAIVGAHFNDGLGWAESGAAYIFHKDEGGENNWQQIKKLVSTDALSQDHFGISVAIDGEIVVVGARYNDAGNTDAGAAYVFYKDKDGVNNWGLHKKITPYSAHDYDQFGTSVDISGNTIIVGANRKDYNDLKYGAAYIFDKDEGGVDNWGEVKAFFSQNPNDGDNFGWSVAIDEDNAIVGAKFDDEFGTDAGSATIFSRNQGGVNNWGAVKLIGGNDIAADDEFGFDVAISGETAVVGAHKHTIGGGTDGEGAVYVFEKDAGGINNWGQIDKLIDPNPYFDEWFGYGVAINGNTIIAGAEQDSFEGTRYGATHIFKHDGTSWVYNNSIRASDGASYDRFGGAVAYDGQYAIISARYDDDNGTSSGSAYLFGPPEPEITTQPVALTDLCVENTYELSVTGNYIEQYQWQLSTDNGVNFSNISDNVHYTGTQTANLNILFNVDMHNYQYRCIVSNVRGSENSVAVNIAKDAVEPNLSLQNHYLELGTDGNVVLLPASVVATASDNCGIVDTTLSQSVFSCEHIGENFVDVTVTDGAGNFVTDQVTVTIGDDLPPNFTASNVVLQLDETGTAQINKEDVFTNVSDNCGVTDSILTKIYFDCSDLGANTVTAYMYDGYNYSPTQDFTVAVEDNMAPEVLVENITVYLDATGSASIVADDILNSVYDNCEVADTVLNKTVFDCSNIGENNINITVSDVNGNETIETAVVTVVDDEVPILVTQDHTLELNENGEATLYNEDVVLNASDNCQLDTTLSQNVFSCTNLGANTIDVTLSDDYNNQTTEQAEITVVDLLAPQVVGQDITIELDETNAATIDKEMVVLSASDNCTVADTLLSQSVFSTGDIGQVTVNITVFDGSGNNTTIPIEVTVLENQSPQLVTRPIYLGLDESGSALIHAADVIESVSDNHQLADTILSHNEFSCNDIGQVTIDVTAIDINGNTTVEQALITIADTLAPIPNENDLPTITAECSVTINETPTATDNCGGEISASTTDPLVYMEQGSYVIEWQFVDNYDNSVLQTQNVTVSDVTPPEIECPSDQNFEIESGAVNYIVNSTELDPLNVSDNCEIDIISNSFNNAPSLEGEILEVGIHQIQWYITDMAGNESTCSFDIEVNVFVAISKLQQQGVEIYPNPANDVLNIEFADSNIQNLTIYDVMGRLMVEKADLQAKERIDLSKFPDGIYLVNLKIGSEILTTRIVKN